MTRYRYLAYAAGGARVSDVIAASSPEQVKQLLWSQGLRIVEIRSEGLRLPSLDEMFPTLLKVKRSEVVLFTRQLATFVRVGMPILDGLAVLRDQSGSRLMKVALSAMLSDLGTGLSLSAAMARHPQIFSSLYVDMIRSAEVSGNLDDVLRQLASYMARDESSIRKVRNAMIYPAIVVTLALAVMGVLITFVLPAFARLFSDFHSTMPLPTRVLLAVGNFSEDHLIWILLAIVLLVAGAATLGRTARGREWWDTLIIKLPLIGPIVRYSVIERYLRTMASLARAGVPVTQMIDTANNSLGNVIFRQRVAAVRDQMLSGDGFAGPLATIDLFPRLVIQMVKVGEETGSLDTNLEEAADHYAEEVDFRLKQMMTTLEPALIIVVGGMVGFIAISVIAPMYSLVHAVR